MKEQEFELLRKINVICRDNGKRFTHTQRLDVISRIAEEAGYISVSDAPLFLMYAKKPLAELPRELLVISTHIDCVKKITTFFTERNDGELYGTFDNSITNAAALLLMKKGTLPDNAVIAFTGNEEYGSAGALAVSEFLKEAGKTFFAVVLDVTHDGYEQNMPFTVENDLWFGKKAGIYEQSIVDGADKASLYWGYVAYSAASVAKLIPNRCRLTDEYGDAVESWEDESWTYSEEEVPCFSLCIPTRGDMHSNKGLFAREADFDIYIKALENIAVSLSLAVKE